MFADFDEMNNVYLDNYITFIGNGTDLHYFTVVPMVAIYNSFIIMYTL